MTPKRFNEGSKYPEMLDSILKSLVGMTLQENPSSTTPSTPPINWLALSDAIPNTDPEMCKRRFMELRNLRLIEREQGNFAAESMAHSVRGNRPGDPLYDYVKMLFKQDEKERRRLDKVNKRNEQKEKQKLESDDTGNTDCETRSTTPSSFPASSGAQNSKSQGGPSMVIHVCDEAKNLRQDFTCPRDLLIQEMRYFAEYLSVDSQRLEEVDISVHCDIHIFDWLMKYVKRDSGLCDLTDQPKLEPNNVISILISSDFLKMDSLVKDCISYCHENLSQIVSTPCNMNCVNERLTDKIAQRFNHTELEEVKDRKDKFKSKLFCRKIEKLFDATLDNPDSPGNASALFKCKYCGKVLTTQQKSKMPCTNTRMCIDGRGFLSYEHQPDPLWDVSNFILSLHDQLKKWGLVYWRLWGIINQLTCSRCDQTFQLCDFGHCQYHAEKPQFRQLLDMQVTDNAVGTYPCCNQRVLRFDPTGLSKGCRFKDHVVSTTKKRQKKLLDDLLTFKHLVTVENQVLPVSSDLNIFSAEEMSCGVSEPTSMPAEIMSAAPAPPPQPKLSSVSLKVQRTVSPSDQYYTGLGDNSEEDVGEEETPNRKFLNSNTSSHMSTIASRSSLSDASVKSQQPFSAALMPSAGPRNIAPTKKGKSKSVLENDDTPYSRFPSKQKWDAARSIRWNQDVQREEDMKRIQEMTAQLAKQRSDRGDKAKTKEREYPGGIFSKLEAAFYANIRSNAAGGASSGRQQGGGSNRDNRLRGRLTQVRY